MVKLKMDIFDLFLRIRVPRLLTFYTERLWHCFEDIVEDLDNSFQTSLETFPLVGIFEFIRMKLADKPILKHFVVISAFTCAIPVIMFILFGIVSVTATFIGFIVIEGTILALAGLCMCMCILLLVLMLSLSAVAVFIFSEFLSNIHYIFDRIEHSQSFYRFSRRQGMLIELENYVR